jgi:hypothetical protein
MKMPKKWHKKRLNNYNQKKYVFEKRQKNGTKNGILINWKDLTLKK